MSLIIFDLDGTLIDSRQDLCDAMNEVRALHHLPPLPEKVTTTYLGSGERNCIRNLMHANVAGEAFEQACRDMRKAYQSRLTVKTVLYPGVAETLAELAKRHILCVASNKPQQSVTQIVETLGVADKFTQVIGGGTCQNLKPDPEIVYCAARLCNTTIENAWMIGDHFTDLETAANAGIHSCLCNYGFGDPKKDHADAVIQCFPQLLTVIENTR